MSEPTAAAMRVTQELFGRHQTDDQHTRDAHIIDNATGLPELIAALDEVLHAYIHEISPQAWLDVMRKVDAALRIASEGRS